MDEAPDAQVEIPYVPVSQRSARREEKDTIVVVGQVCQKRKRKAGKSVTSDQEAASSTKRIDDAESNAQPRATNAEESQEPFDFASVPNILDDDPEAGKGVEEENEKRRKRQKKTNKKGVLNQFILIEFPVTIFFCDSSQGGTFYGEFPAPPKARAELKSGNKSHTFK
jgi:exosome complex exonuclease RRP6